MLAALAVVVLVATAGMRDGWRIAGRLTVLGLAVCAVELAIIQSAPSVGAWIVEVAK
jgi:hypothetical protein